MREEIARLKEVDEKGGSEEERASRKALLMVLRKHGHSIVYHIISIWQSKSGYNEESITVPDQMEDVSLNDRPKRSGLMS